MIKIALNGNLVDNLRNAQLNSAAVISALPEDNAYLLKYVKPERDLTGDCL